MMYALLGGYTVSMIRNTNMGGWTDIVLPLLFMTRHHGRSLWANPLVRVFISVCSGERSVVTMLHVGDDNAAVSESDLINCFRPLCF